MGSEDLKRLLIIVSLFLLIFAVFVFAFWQRKSATLRQYQLELQKKSAELKQLELDAKDWPEKFDREKMDRYKVELDQLLRIIPAEEETGRLVDQIQGRARSSGLDIVLLNRETAAGEDVFESDQLEPGEKSRYVKVPYRISLDGGYFGVIEFLRELEKSERLVTVDDIQLGGLGTSVKADIQFNIFYSRVEVEIVEE